MQASQSRGVERGFESVTNLEEDPKDHRGNLTDLRGECQIPH